MINIKSELQALEAQRKRNYISIVELFAFFKKGNPGTSFCDIATFLSFKLAPNDVRKTDDELWGNEDFNAWLEQNGISIFTMPKSIADKPKIIDQYFFFDALEYVREHPGADADSLFNEPNDAEEILLQKNYQDIFIDRARIDSLLGVNTLEKHDAILVEQSESPVFESSTVNLQAENEALKQRIAELEAQLEAKENQVSTTVNYDDFSIYGHTSENIKIIFELSKKISKTCDPENPHSYPSKEHIREYVTKYFYDSASLAEAIHLIITPSKVKTRGRPPKGVETFKGFIPEKPSEEN